MPEANLEPPQEPPTFLDRIIALIYGFVAVETVLALVFSTIKIEEVV